MKVYYMEFYTKYIQGGKYSSIKYSYLNFRLLSTGFS